MNEMISKITGGPTKFLFAAKVLGKYDVKYFQCEQTGFIQTEDPYWLDEAYSEAITKLDIGLPHRNIHLSNRLERMMLQLFDDNSKFLDYAGGYGLFARLMRDKGFDFYTTDKYCKNIFAEYFGLSDLPSGTKFSAVTAFEVFEHLTQPFKEVIEMLSYADNLIFSTELVPHITPNSINDWWYFIPETGQHVGFYTKEALQYIGKQIGFNFYTDGFSLHMFTKCDYKINPFAVKKDAFLVKQAKQILRKEEKKFKKLESLLMADWQLIKGKLR